MARQKNETAPIEETTVEVETSIEEVTVETTIENAPEEFPTPTQPLKPVIGEPEPSTNEEAPAEETASDETEA